MLYFTIIAIIHLVLEPSLFFFLVMVGWGGLSHLWASLPLKLTPKSWALCGLRACTWKNLKMINFEMSGKHFLLPEGPHKMAGALHSEHLQYTGRAGPACSP